MIVLDCSAMLAFLNEEQGGELVASLLLDNEREVGVFAHAINLCEVHYDVAREYSVSEAESSIQSLLDAGIRERNDMDSEFWRCGVFDS